MTVPLVDLAWQHREIEGEIRAGFDRVFADTNFILGEPVAEFEARFARFMGADHCIGVGSGTDGLELALRSLGIGSGDEVIVPAHTFVATALAVLRSGATPVLADVDPDAMLLDPEQVERRLSARTRAIMPVHLYGQMAPMKPLESLARARGLSIVEDAAQSQGATQEGRSAGSLGAASATSFYPGKNIGAYGDAGAVLTSDEEVKGRLHRLRNWGSDLKYHHPEIGFNSRLDTLQAVVLTAKLARLAAWNELRGEAALRYDELLADEERVVRPCRAAGNHHVFHLYVLRLANSETRDRVLGELNQAGIGAGVHYPVPLHAHGALAGLGHQRGDFPQAEGACEQVLSLPLFPGISARQQESVTSALSRALDGASG